MNKELRKIFVTGDVDGWIKYKLQLGIEAAGAPEESFHLERMSSIELPVSVRKESRAYLWEHNNITEKPPISVDEICQSKYKLTFKKPLIVVQEGFSLIGVCTDNYTRSRWFNQLLRDTKGYYERVTLTDFKIQMKNRCSIILVVQDDDPRNIGELDPRRTVWRTLV